MAFCANCGNKVGENDKFCAACGTTRVPGAPTAQPAPPPPAPVYQAAPVHPQAPPPVPPPPAPVYQAAPVQPQTPPVYNAPMGGYQQPPPAPMAATTASGESSTGLKANIAGLLCYVFGWITGIVFLVLEKKSSFVKFHAVQSIVVFGFLNILSIFIRIIFSNIFGTLLSFLVGMATLILWIVLMLKAYQGEMYKLPIVGDIAAGIAKV